jgi:conjugal transfer pilus assembly protein TraW
MSINNKIYPYFAALTAAFLLNNACATTEQLGVFGNVYPVQEKDAINSIKDKITLMQKDGRMDAIKKEWTEKALSRIENGPDPVPGIGKYKKDNVRLFNPAIELTQNVTDDQGRIIAPAGTKLNPMDYMSLKREYLFIDGTDQKQVDWAVKYSQGKGGDLKARIILVNGSPTKVSKKSNQRIFFDQDGRIVRHFSITAVPTILRGGKGNVEIVEIARY